MQTPSHTSRIASIKIKTEHRYYRTVYTIISYDVYSKAYDNILQQNRNGNICETCIFNIRDEMEVVFDCEYS